MLILNTTTCSIEVKLGGTVTTNQLPVVSSYVDFTGTAFIPGSTQLTTNNTIAVTPVPAPGASTQRQVKQLTVFNADTVAATVTVRYNNNGTTSNIVQAALAANSTLQYNDGEGWRTTDSTGATLTTSSSSGGNPFADNTALVKNNADNTKLIIVSAASITTGTTRTLTAQDANYTIAGTTVSLGGTGVATFTSNGVLYGNGTGALQVTAAGTASQVLGGGTPPAFAAFTGFFPISDSTILLQGSGDATKQLRIEIDGFTTGNTRVLTPQDASYTLAGLETAQTFTKANTFNITDAVTNASTTVITIGHSSSGTPAASFGVTQMFQLDDSTTANQSALGLVIVWATATHASRKARATFQLYDAGGARECFRMEASGSAPIIGFYGTGAVAQATVSGSTFGNTGLTSLLTALGNSTGLGLIVDSTTAGGSTLAAFTPLDNQPPATNYAVLGSRNNHTTLEFDNSTNWDAIFEGVLARNYAGGNVVVTIVWAAKTLTTGNVAWLGSWERLNANNHNLDTDAFTATQTSTADACNGTNGKLTISTITFTSSQIDSLAAGDAFRFKLTRDTTAASNLAARAQVVSVEIKG